MEPSEAKDWIEHLRGLFPNLTAPQAAALEVKIQEFTNNAVRDGMSLYYTGRKHGGWCKADDLLDCIRAFEPRPAPASPGSRRPLEPGYADALRLVAQLPDADVTKLQTLFMQSELPSSLEVYKTRPLRPRESIRFAVWVKQYLQEHGGAIAA